MPTAEELRQQIYAVTGDPKAEQQEDTPVDPAPVADPPAATDPAAPVVDPAPAPRVAGEPYQVGKNWQVDIDLEDGSGVQTFKAETKTGLIKELSKAQTHASRKIKELNKARKEAIKPDPIEAVPEYKPTDLTEDEKFLLAQEMQTDPTGAIAKLFKSTVGATPDEIREALILSRQYGVKVKAQQEAQAFMAAHPDYQDTKANVDVMNQYLVKNNMAVTKQNLELAYQDLLEANLLEVETQETPGKSNTIQSIEAPVSRTSGIVRPPQKKAHVGISSRQVASTADEDDSKPSGLSVEDLLKLPYAERRRIAELEAMKEAERSRR